MVNGDGQLTQQAISAKMRKIMVIILLFFSPKHAKIKAKSLGKFDNILLNC